MLRGPEHDAGTGGVAGDDGEEGARPSRGGVGAQDAGAEDAGVEDVGVEDAVVADLERGGDVAGRGDHRLPRHLRAGEARLRADEARPHDEGDPGRDARRDEARRGDASPVAKTMSSRNRPLSGVGMPGACCIGRPVGLIFRPIFRPIRRAPAAALAATWEIRAPRSKGTSHGPMAPGPVLALLDVEPGVPEPVAQRALVAERQRRHATARPPRRCRGRPGR